MSNDDPISQFLGMAIDSIMVMPTAIGEQYVVEAFGRIGAGESEVYPQARSIEEIVAAEALPSAAMAASKVTPY